MRIIYLILICVLTACGSKQSKPTTQPQAAVVVPTFNADSAYRYTAEQVAFGPRVPNTEAHVACGHWLAQELERFGAQVTSQHVTLRAYDGTPLKACLLYTSPSPRD